MTPIPSVIPMAQVARAYATGTANPSPDTAAGTQAGDFAGMVGDAAESAMQTMRQAEQVTAQGVAGKADVQQVVQALSNAEVTMQAVVAVRDKVLGAYNDIMHMNV
jgi:flagellar hook-basal body complex protein FliE